MSKNLSVVMIVKNVAHILSESLASVINWVDEIILLDSGSNDDTIEIAVKAGVKIFTSSDWPGYGIQRQRAQRLATGNYILMIDADEQVTPELRRSIQSVLVNPTPKVVYSISRRNYFIGRFMRHSGWYPDRVIRLYERDRYEYNNNQVHESLSCKDAKVTKLKGDLLHMACCDFTNFQHKQLDYAVTWAREKYQHGRTTSLNSIFIHTIFAFLKTLILRCGFLDGKQGWILSVVNAVYVFHKYVVLWTMKKNFLRKV